MICGIKSFLMMDLVKPDAVRFRSILSGMMNFAKFRSVFSSRVWHMINCSERADHTSSLVYSTKFMIKPRGQSLPIIHRNKLTYRLHRLQKEVQAVEDDIEDIKWVLVCSLEMPDLTNLGQRQRPTNPRLRRPSGRTTRYETRITNTTESD
jgi:hypothetical protein